MPVSPLDAFKDDGTLFIDGQWQHPIDGSYLETHNPSTGEVLATVSEANEEDVTIAASAALRARDAWSNLPWTRRAAYLRGLADEIAAHSEELALLDALDSGNPISAMRDDVDAAVKGVRFFAGLGSELKGHTYTNGPGQFAYSRLEPYGVVGRIIPFNHPLMFAAGKIAAPLMAGNTVLLKPSEVTSLSAIRLLQLIDGLFPPGVVNLITGGAAAGTAIAGHPDVPRVAFTGSLQTGRAVLRAGAESVKHVTLELGGKNPMIVFEDVDVDMAATAAVKSMNLARCQGQSCQSTSRIFVHEDIYDQFSSSFVAAAEALRIGAATKDDTDMGPLAFEQHMDRVLGYIKNGVEEGASLLTGGSRLDSPGYFVSPTVFGNVENGMKIAQEEIFGPVVCLLRWRDQRQVIAEANDVEYGLTANIWTNDLRRAHLAAHAIEAGYVSINGSGRRVPGTPFGGYKHSGIGRENSIEELLSFCQTKAVAVFLEGSG